MVAGSAAQVLLAWEEGERMHRGLRGAKFTATTLAGVRRRGWAASAAEREVGVASVSAPVRGAGGKVLAAVSVSGPIERLTRSPAGCTRRRSSRPATGSASSCAPTTATTPSSNTTLQNGGSVSPGCPPWQRGTSPNGRRSVPVFVIWGTTSRDGLMRCPKLRDVVLPFAWAAD